MIQVYYGDGKGKTTALVGAAVRAAGSGMKVLFIQFLKNGDSSECPVLDNLQNICLLKPLKSYRLMQSLDTKQKEILKTEYDRLLQYAIDYSAKYGMIVLDEVLDAIELKVLNKNLLLEFLNETKSEVLLSGHHMSQEILDVSDYASEIKMIKHPYQNGIKSRKGIEY